MTEETETPPPARSANCKATAVDDQMICARCGLQWDLVDQAPPACEPMTFKRMRARLEAEIYRVDQSLGVVNKLKADGSPADPRPERRRLSELEALLRLFDRVTETKQQRDQILGKAKT